MNLLKRFLSKKSAPERLFVLGLDGVGLDLANGLAKQGVSPTLGRMLQSGVTLPLKPVLPTVSTVAWATYATGVNPGRHGIFGFVDRSTNPFTMQIPTARDLRSPTIWELLSREGRRVGVINVPLTYPPKPVNGFMVSGFLSPELGKATHPVELAPRLMELDYRIEADTDLVQTDFGAYLNDLGETMGRRFSACFKLMTTEPWDLMQLHIMGTDRVNHFLWGEMARGGEGAEEFFSFYRRLDSYLAELLEHLPEGCRLFVLSDHGFSTCKGSVFINRWLEENGYLLFGRGKKELLNMHPDSRAYSLVPGRVYVNLKGREERGSVARGGPYEDLREELAHRLAGITHPDDGEPLVRKVYRKEELYDGAHLNRAPDLVIDPVPGFELKANLDAHGLVGPPELSGTHTAEHAFWHLMGVRGLEHRGEASLMDLAPTILNLLGCAQPGNLEGQTLI